MHTESRTRLLFFCLHPGLDVSEFVHTAGQNFDKICTKCAEEVAEDFTYEELNKEVSDGNFTHAFVVPPGRTFTSALRGNTPPEVYGFKSISVGDKNEVRTETLTVLRAAEIITKFHELGRPWLFENNVDSEPNVFMLPEVRNLLLLPGVSVTRFFHCSDDAHHNAGSRIVGNVPLHSLDTDMLTQKENYFSSALRKGCASMCKHWAFPILRLLLLENGEQRGKRENSSLNLEPEARQKISYTVKLRGEQLNAKELRALDDKQALAGLRNASEAISRIPGHIELGTILASLFRKILRQSPRLRELLVLLGSGQSTPDTQEGLSAELETLLVSARECLAKVLRCSDTEPVNMGECSTNIRAELLKRWSGAARDPRTGVCEWLKFGANAGLSADPTGIDGVFTRADDKTSPNDCLFEEFVAHCKGDSGR